MKYAILADIHANLPAFEAVLADSRERKCTHYACAGDIVGYGRQPRECVRIVREMGMPCVKGDHDQYSSCETERTDFNPHATMMVKWTRDQLSEDDREWLRNLKHVEIVDGFTLVHSTLDNPHNWQYVFEKLAATASFPYQGTTACFFGHIHIHVAFTRETNADGMPVVRSGTASKIRIDADKKYFVCVGSVGQPRDTNPKSAYATFNVDTQIVELHRVDYDWKRADGPGGANLN
jgi:predicted phosphodiesterase